MLDQEELKKYHSFLKKLAEPKERDDLFKEMSAIYENNERHKYSMITGFLYENKDNVSEYFTSISDNLRKYIDDKLCEECKNHNKQEKYEEYKKRLEKMLDHIELESIRLFHLQMVESNISESAKEISNVKEDINKRAGEISNVKEDIDKQKNQYITILGIFASIVLAFVGSFTFSNSIFSNMHQVGISKLAFTMCLNVVFFANILFFLFDFLEILTR